MNDLSLNFDGSTGTLITRIAPRRSAKRRVHSAVAAACAAASLATAGAAFAQVTAPPSTLTSTAVAPPGTLVGALVNNTATSAGGANAVRPGLYLWTGSQWLPATTQSAGASSVGIGPGSAGTGTNSIAVGSLATAVNPNAIAIGANSTATSSSSGVGSVAIGGGTGVGPTPQLNQSNRAGTAVGFGSQSLGAGDGGGSAFGTYATANGGAYNTATGYRANASAPGLGAANPLNPTYSGAVATGAFSTASATGATALGSNSIASATGGVALGNFSVADRAAGVAGFVPAGATPQETARINATNSTILGAVSVGGGSAGGTALGTRQITNVAAGSADSDAVNVAQLAATNKAVADTAVENRQYTEGRINVLREEVLLNQKDARAGTAGAMAMATMPQAASPGKSMMAAGVASFQGQTALAIGYSRFSDSGKWVLKLNGSANSRRAVGVAAGAGFSW